MTYYETINYIKNTAKFGTNLGLERTNKILELLGNPHKQIKCIHIAGTNGKGSTTVMISNILIEEGYKVGMYISPYIEVFEERIQLSGNNIPKEDLCNVVEEVSKAVDKVISLGYSHPTEFEIITCAMFLYFCRQNVDYAVIEVGMGGRLDSTNVIMPILSVITSISYDHMQVLGDTLSKIAYEKAGIIKNNIPVILYPQGEDSYKVIKDVAHERNSKLIEVQRNSVTLKNIDDNCFQHICVNTSKEIYEIKLSLLGSHQLLNCATAIYAIEELITQGIKIQKSSILRALENVKWPGRLEVMRKKPLVVIDGAHNIDGIKMLSKSIDTYFKYQKLTIILGILADKQVDNMANVIAAKADKIITITPHNARAESADELLKVVKRYNINCEAVNDYEEAYNKALGYSNDNDMILISGSLSTIGEMKKIIRNYR